MQRLYTETTLPCKFVEFSNKYLNYYNYFVLIQRQKEELSIANKYFFHPSLNMAQSKTNEHKYKFYSVLWILFEVRALQFGITFDKRVEIHLDYRKQTNSSKKNLNFYTTVCMYPILCTKCLEYKKYFVNIVSQCAFSIYMNGKQAYAKEPRNNNWYKENVVNWQIIIFERTRNKKHIIWSQHEGERLVTKFHCRLKGEKLLFMFLIFQYFPVCFSKTIKVMLITLTVYAITVKTNTKPSENQEFP